MRFDVIPSDKFKKEAKRLIKKFPSLKQELARLNAVLETEPNTGMPLGNGIYKIRISVKSKGKGKSGGARVITFIISADKDVYLLTIYDKSEFDSLDDKTVRNIINSLDIK